MAILLLLGHVSAIKLHDDADDFNIMSGVSDDDLKSAFAEKSVKSEEKKVEKKVEEKKEQKEEKKTQEKKDDTEK